MGMVAITGVGRAVIQQGGLNPFHRPACFFSIRAYPMSIQVLTSKGAEAYPQAHNRHNVPAEQDCIDPAVINVQSFQLLI